MGAPDDSLTGASPEWERDASSDQQEDERERRALRLAAEAQALPVEEQALFLAAACAADPALLRAASMLLSRINAEGAHEGFLSEPALVFAKPLVRAVDESAERAMAVATDTVRRALAERYDMREEVGRGGYAVVHRAHDLRHHREVAIKIVACDEGESASSLRFTKEIEIVARLQHPYIVPLLDSGRTEGALYYVMPFIDGETLRQRLDREDMLSVEDALAVARDVAEALDAAHAVGVVHRDIKPSNILLPRSHAVVTDFGIALATESSATRMTATGMVIGTPHYMSPEQAAGDVRIDARSDIYSLACVIYEMLAGEVPFTGAGAHAVRAKHLHAAIPNVTILRPTLPHVVHDVLARALAKSPSDRYPSAGALIAELQRAISTSTPTRAADIAQPAGIRSWARSASLRSRTTGVLLAAAALVGIAVVITRPPRSLPALPLDAMTFALFPLERHGAVPSALNEGDRLRDALREWEDLRLVDALSLEERLPGTAGARLPLTASQRVSGSLGAGRFVRGSVSADREGVWLRVMLYRTDSLRMEGEASIRLSASLAGLDTSFQQMVSELLFRETRELLPHAVQLDRPNTRSYLAYRDFLRGQLAIASWDLEVADSAFARATHTDRGYPQAWLWLGLTRRWALREPALWQGAAQQASYGIAQLGARDSALAVALLASAEQDIPTACRTLRALTVRAPDDFAAWYASADCMGRDSVVVRDEQGTGEWRFRSSRHTALEHYRRAFLLMPSILRGLRPNGFAAARRLFQVNRSILANGVAAPPDTTVFYAFPVLDGDSLVHIVTPVRDYHRGTTRDMPWKQGSRYAAMMTAASWRDGSPSAPSAAAHQRQRRVFREVAAAWAAESRSSEAYEALGLALQWLGDPAAIDTLAAARRLASSPLARTGATATSIVAGLLLGAPDDTAMLHTVVGLADSLLADPALVRADPRTAATIAAITGRVFTAAQLAQGTPGVPSEGMAPRLRRAVEGLFTFGLFGGPVDTLRRLESAVEELLRRETGNTPLQRTMALRRPAVLALPHHQMQALFTLDASRDPLVGAEQALLSGNGPMARDRLDYIAASRRDLTSDDITFDGILPEAHILRALGDTPGAIAHLDPALESLSRRSLGMTDMAAVVSLTRAMILRADLAAEVGDRDTARRWARVIAILWRRADPFLQATVRRMESLMS